MSWHFSQALEAAYSEANCLDGELSWPSSVTLIAPDDLCKDKMKPTYLRSPFGMMYVPSTDTHGAALLTWYLRDSPARTLVKQEAERDSKENAADYGEKPQELSEKFVLNTSFWKIRQTLFGRELMKFSETCPRWGLMQDGECWEVKPLVQIKREKGSGYWLTPTVEDFKRRGSAKAWTEYKTTGRTTCARLRNQVQEQPDGEGFLTPEFAESLMWWPIGWSGVAPLATDKFQQWLNWHGRF